MNGNSTCLYIVAIVAFRVSVPGTTKILFFYSLSTSLLAAISYAIFKDKGDALFHLHIFLGKVDLVKQAMLEPPLRRSIL